VVEMNDPDSPEAERNRELICFLIITVVFFPMVALIFVGGYGTVVWISQLIGGPPGVGG
jgi:nitrate reductase NapE